jgi:hypothetical protein
MKAPTIKAKLTSISLKYIAETTLDNKIDKEVANPFSTLSAYFTTIATSIPPAACRKITPQTQLLYPARKPLFEMSSESRR